MRCVLGVPGLLAGLTFFSLLQKACQGGYAALAMESAVSLVCLVFWILVLHLILGFKLKFLSVK